MNGAYDKATQLIKDNIDSLHNLAEALLERETLDGEEVERIMEGEKKLEGDEGEAPSS